MRHFFFGSWIDAQSDLPGDLGRDLLSSQVMADRLASLREVSVDEILSLLHRVGVRMTEPGPYRDRIIRSMPDITGFPLSMVEMGVDVLKSLLSRESLEERLSCLGDRRVLDCWTEVEGRPVRARALGALCHVAAGNIFLGSVDSLVMGLITKNVNVLKISRQDRVFPFIFLDALLEEDRSGVVSSSIAVTSWSHNNGEMMDLVGRRFDGILLFGGEDAVKTYRGIASPGTEVLAFGPKISWGLVREGLSTSQLEEAVKGFAMDVALWEQRACTSCQNIFIQGQALGETVGEMLHRELSSLESSMPQDRVSLDEAVDIRKERESAFWDQTQGSRRIWEGRGHTVILGRGASVVPSPLNRTVFLSVVDDWRELLEGDLKDMGYYMSTVGLAVPDDVMDETVEEIQKLGVLRFCLPGTMGLGADGKASHDGVYLALNLVRLVNREDIAGDLLGLTRLDEARRSSVLLGRINRVLSSSLKAPFYRDRFASVSLPLRDLSELSSVPVLEKADLEVHCPPSLDMITEPDSGGYLFSSGGTSGHPRRIRWTSSEFDQSGQALGRGFKALGIGPDDVVANLMVAGSLYTGFLAVNRGLEETGCSILSLTANQPVSETVALLRDLRPSVVMAMTSTLIELAGAVLDGEPLSIDRIFYTGETMARSSLELVTRAFSPSRVGSLSYGAVEIGPIGYQCPHCRHDQFHVEDSWAHVEIDDDGEIYVTALERTLHPIVRYRLGDRGKWVDEPCGCGRTSRRFSLMGRCDDSVRLLYNDLYLEDVDQAICGFPGLSPVYQLVVEEGPEVTLIVEGKDSPGLEESFLRDLKARADQFKDLADFGCPFRLSVVPPRTIERLGRTGKVRRIVDRRER